MTSAQDSGRVDLEGRVALEATSGDVAAATIAALGLPIPLHECPGCRYRFGTRRGLRSHVTRSGHRAPTAFGRIRGWVAERALQVPFAFVIGVAIGWALGLAQATWR